MQRLAALILERRPVRNDSGDPFHGGREGRSSLLPELVFGMDKRYVCEPKQAEDVP